MTSIPVTFKSESHPPPPGEREIEHAARYPRSPCALHLNFYLIICLVMIGNSYDTFSILASIQGGQYNKAQIGERHTPVFLNFRRR